MQIDIQCGNYRNMSTGFAYVVQGYRGGQWVDLKEFSGGFMWSQSRDFTRALDAEEKKGAKND
jgi:hypothetical protein